MAGRPPYLWEHTVLIVKPDAAGRHDEVFAALLSNTSSPPTSARGIDGAASKDSTHATKEGRGEKRGSSLQIPFTPKRIGGASDKNADAKEEGSNADGGAFFSTHPSPSSSSSHALPPPPPPTLPLSITRRALRPLSRRQAERVASQYPYLRHAFLAEHLARLESDDAMDDTSEPLLHVYPPHPSSHAIENTPLSGKRATTTAATPPHAQRVSLSKPPPLPALAIGSPSPRASVAWANTNNSTAASRRETTTGGGALPLLRSPDSPRASVSLRVSDAASAVTSPASLSLSAHAAAAGGGGGGGASPIGSSRRPTAALFLTTPHHSRDASEATPLSRQLPANAAPDAVGGGGAGRFGASYQTFAARGAPVRFGDLRNPSSPSAVFFRCRAELAEQQQQQQQQHGEEADAEEDHDGLPPPTRAATLAAMHQLRQQWGAAITAHTTASSSASQQQQKQQGHPHSGHQQKQQHCGGGAPRLSAGKGGVAFSALRDADGRGAVPYAYPQRADLYSSPRRRNQQQQHYNHSPRYWPDGGSGDDDGGTHSEGLTFMAEWLGSSARHRFTQSNAALLPSFAPHRSVHNHQQQQHAGTAAYSPLAMPPNGTGTNVLRGNENTNTTIDNNNANSLLFLHANALRIGNGDDDASTTVSIAGEAMRLKGSGSQFNGPHAASLFAQTNGPLHAQLQQPPPSSGAALRLDLDPAVAQSGGEANTNASLQPNATCTAVLRTAPPAAEASAVFRSTSGAVSSPQRIVLPSAWASATQRSAMNTYMHTHAEGPARENAFNNHVTLRQDEGKHNNRRSTMAASMALRPSPSPPQPPFLSAQWSPAEALFEAACDALVAGGTCLALAVSGPGAVARVARLVAPKHLWTATECRNAALGEVAPSSSLQSAAPLTTGGGVGGCLRAAVAGGTCHLHNGFFAPETAAEATVLLRCIFPPEQRRRDPLLPISEAAIADGADASGGLEGSSLAVAADSAADDSESEEMEGEGEAVASPLLPLAHLQSPYVTRNGIPSFYAEVGPLRGDSLAYTTAGGLASSVVGHGHVHHVPRPPPRARAVASMAAAASHIVCAHECE